MEPLIDLGRALLGMPERTLTQRDVALQPRGEGDPKTEHCVVCSQAIRVQIFKGLGVCGEAHRKMRDDVPTGDGAMGGWYHTCAKNLVNHHMHKVRFSLPDPFQVFEGVIGQVTSGDEDIFVTVYLEDGCQITNPIYPNKPRTHEGVFQTDLHLYKVVEVAKGHK